MKNKTIGYTNLTIEDIIKIASEAYRKASEAYPEEFKDDKKLECYSLNKEEWTLDESYILDQIGEDNYKDNEIVYIGKASFMEHKNYLNISYLIESTQDLAYEDFEGSDDYLSEFIENRNKSKKYIELEDLILNWLNKNINQPNWYNPINIKEITVNEFKEKYDN